MRKFNKQPGYNNCCSTDGYPDTDPKFIYFNFLHVEKLKLSLLIHLPCQNFFYANFQFVISLFMKKDVGKSNTLVCFHTIILNLCTAKLTCVPFLYTF